MKPDLRRLAPAIIGFATISAPAQAACIYQDVDNAQTTIAQEFNDAPLVVRARVASADYHWSLDGPSWTIYSLTMIERYKGVAPENLRLFTLRDSGGFYLDRDDAPLPSEEEFLLFLTPVASRIDIPAPARSDDGELQLRPLRPMVRPDARGHTPSVETGGTLTNSRMPRPPAPLIPAEAGTQCFGRQGARVLVRRAYGGRRSCG